MSKESQQITAERCTGTKRDGKPCGNWAVPGSHPPRCPWHGGTRAGKGTRCTAVTIVGPQCRGWAVPGSVPPLCNLHGGRRPGADEPASTYPLKHGRYVGRRAHTAAKKAAEAADKVSAGLEPEAVARLCSLDGVITDLHKQHQQLSDYIDAHLEFLEPEALARLLRVFDEVNATLVTLLRDQRRQRDAEPENVLEIYILETLALMGGDEP